MPLIMNKSLIATGILLVMAFTLSCSDDKEESPPPATNPNPVTPFACVHDNPDKNSTLKLCSCFLSLPSSEAEKTKNRCLDNGGSIMNKCPSNSLCYAGGQQIDCPSSCY